MDEWKCAIVTPLHKKGKLDDLNNYRGISVLPPLNKVFEKVLAQQIRDYFDSFLISLGAPQGSILGPLLFIIFINDLPKYLSNVVSKLFAEDTTLIAADGDFRKLESKLIKCLEALDEWCKHNRLYINWDKTFIMYITNKRILLIGRAHV